MNLRAMQLYFFLTVCSFSSVLSCRWIKHKYQHHHGISLNLLRNMGEKVPDDNEDLNPIPYEMINNHRTAKPEKQIQFVIQVLSEITDLFEEEFIPWDAKRMDDFLNIMHKEMDGLRSCASYKLKRNKKLHLYFNKLRQMTKLNKDKNRSWEMVRKRVISLMNQLHFFSFHNHV